jgi:hypothetical protein
MELGSILMCDKSAFESVNLDDVVCSTTFTCRTKNDDDLRFQLKNGVSLT